ncbi:glycoside hydrolase family 3 N-terminal domain-containing protein [Streptomyces sp. NPDC051940]|uniref:glycoside hydrolase family 3 protein n=1 Tax=Streptomyces sp. NPDC051940 TaxID=3155675 RepID=UPI00342A335D
MPTSRRTFLAAAAAAAAGTAAAGLTAGAARADDQSDDDRIHALIDRMSLEERVGQLFVMRVYGHSATDPGAADAASNRATAGVDSAAELIARYHVGGIIYFAWANNTRDPHQIAGLSNGIQQAGLAQPTPVPLLISTDQEHGRVVRIGAPATLFPGAMALGAGGLADDAYLTGRVSGAELRAMGIRQNYSPVADVNVDPANPVIGVRSFGADPQAVAPLVAAEVRGYQKAGIAATAKHFPGHGDTSQDSHQSFPHITHTREEWLRIDAPPFRAAIAAGIDAIMTAHIAFPEIDPAGDPATLSYPFLTGILREELGYDGVVVTDSLGMVGVRQRYGDARVPVLALLAGCDQLLNPPDFPLAWNATLEAVRGGEVPMARVEQALTRILRLKLRRGLFDEPYVTHDGVDATVGTPAHRAIAARVADRTTTVLVNDGLLPLDPHVHGRVLVTGVDGAAPLGTSGPPTTVLARELERLGFTPTVLPAGTAAAPNPSAAKTAAAVAAAREHDAVVAVTLNAHLNAGQRAFTAALTDTGVPVVHLASWDPYDIAHLTGVRASVASYTWMDAELTAAARVIGGKIPPAGRLPVDVPRADDPSQLLYGIGHGLTW